MEPNFPRAHIIVFAYVQVGMFAEALRDVTEWQKGHDGPFAWMMFAYVHGRAGHQTEALRYLHRLEAERSAHYVDSSKMMLAYLGLGDKDHALQWCDKAVAERSTLMVWLKVDPVYDPLRPDARFQILLSKIGFD